MASQQLSRAARQISLHNGKGRPSPASSLPWLARSARPYSALSSSTRSPLLRKSYKPILITSPGSIRALSFWSTPAKPPAETATPATPPATPTPNPATPAAESTAAAPVSAASSDAIAPEATSLDSFSILDSQLPNIDPHIGYLNELGLDFGWGATSSVQWMIEHIQVSTGVPMAGAVVLSVVLARTVLLPLFISASDAQARLATMAPVMKPIQEKMRAAQAAGNTQDMMLCRQELSALNKKSGIRYRDIFFPMFLQIPLGYGLFRVTRAMASVPLPELQATSLAWLTDLTVADPMYVIPALTSGIMYMTLKAGGEAGETSGAANPAMTKMLRTAMPTLSFAFTSFMPAITQIGFFAGAVWSFGQATIFKNAAARRLLGIHPLPVRGRPLAAGATPVPAYSGTINKATGEAAEVQAPTGLAANLKAKFYTATKDARENLRETTKTAREYADRKQKKHARLTPSEIKSAEAYEARKRKAEKEEAEWRAEADRKLRLRQSPVRRK